MQINNRCTHPQIIVTANFNWQGYRDIIGRKLLDILIPLLEVLQSSVTCHNVFIEFIHPQRQSRATVAKHTGWRNNLFAVQTTIRMNPPDNRVTKPAARQRIKSMHETPIGTHSNCQTVGHSDD